MDTLGWIILSIIERLSSFRGNNVLPLYELVHWKVSFIQRCPLFRVSLSEVPLYYGFLARYIPLFLFQGAYMVQRLAQKLDQLLSQPPDYGRGKECNCVLLLIAYLYTFKVTYIPTLLRCMVGHKVMYLLYSDLPL